MNTKFKKGDYVTGSNYLRGYYRKRLLVLDIVHMPEGVFYRLKSEQSIEDLYRRESELEPWDNKFLNYDGCRGM